MSGNNTTDAVLRLAQFSVETTAVPMTKFAISREVDELLASSFEPHNYAADLTKVYSRGFACGARYIILRRGFVSILER